MKEGTRGTQWETLKQAHSLGISVTHKFMLQQH